MNEPKSISDAIAHAIHRRQIAEHGGMDGVRDASLLDSALSKPKNLFHYADPKPSISEIAATYAYGIARNHAFIDGNKRAALVVCRLFIALNGVEFKATAADKYQIFMKLAAGEVTEEELADWLSSHSRKYVPSISIFSR